jgi:hypothetical protein
MPAIKAEFSIFSSWNGKEITGMVKKLQVYLRLPSSGAAV